MSPWTRRIAGRSPALDRLDAGKRTGVTDDRCRRGLARQAHGEREHGALAEADEAERARGELHALELGIEKGVQHRAGLATPFTSSFGSRNVRLNHCRPIGAMPHGSGACGDTKAACGSARAHSRPSDQVVAVGAIAVKEDDELLRLTTGRGGEPRSVETRRGHLDAVQADHGPTLSSGTSSAESALSWP